jgi:hypothetical protein
MFSNFSNAVFSNEGLAKLNSLKVEVELLAKQNYKKNESSEYSQNMALTIIDIIELVSGHNSITYWSKEKNVASLTKLFDALDSGKSTLVPEIFNTQSHELAQLLLQHLENIVIGKDLNMLAETALKKIANPAALLEVMINNITYKIQLYEMFKNNETETKTMKKIAHDMLEYFKKLDDKNELINFNFSSLKYAKQCNLFIDRINKTPYLRICNAVNFVNLDKPYNIKTSDLHSAGNRVTLINELLLSEMYLNQTLRKNGIPTIVTTAYETYSSCFSLNLHHDIVNKQIFLCYHLINVVTGYIKGDHLNKKGLMSLFASVDANKAECAQLLISETQKIISKINDGKGNESFIGFNCFDLFKYILDAINSNENIAIVKKTSLGNLSKILNELAIQFFNITFNDINQTNDIGILKQLKKYEEECDLAVVSPEEKASLGMY